MKLSLTKRLILYIIGITFGLLIIAVFIVAPSVSKILTIKEDTNNIQGELEKRYQRTQKLKRSIQELNSLKEETKIFAQATIRQGEELRVITELENLANIYNIDQTLNLKFYNIDEDNPVKGINAKAYALPQYYQFSFLNNGQFEDQIKYLQALETLPYYLTIDNLRLEKRGGEENIKFPITIRFDAILYVDPT